MSDQWQAPFTDAQMDALYKHQRGANFHPYTCGNRCGSDREGVMAVTRNGLVCFICGYRQTWTFAHAISTPLQAEGTPNQ